MRRKTLYIYPNKAAVKIAKEAIDRRRKIPKSKRGGLDPAEAHEQGIGSGVNRARDIAAGKRINAYQVKAFFDRHRHNFLNAKAKGLRWEDSKAWQAWDLWGGEPLRKQVEKEVREDKKNREKNPHDLSHVQAYEPSRISNPPIKVKELRNRPDTVDVPSLSKLKVGDMVKISRNGERFWVKVVGFQRTKIHGAVANDLIFNEDLPQGTQIVFYKKHIFEHADQNPKKKDNKKDKEPRNFKVSRLPKRQYDKSKSTWMPTPTGRYRARLGTLPEYYQNMWAREYRRILRALKPNNITEDQKKTIASRMAWKRVKDEGCKLPTQKRSRDRDKDQRWICLESQSVRKKSD